MEMLNLKILDDVMVTEEFRVKISSRFVALEYLEDSKSINRAYECIRQNKYIIISGKERLVSKNKSNMIHDLKNAQNYLSMEIKLHYLRDPSEINED
jgi:hypothetical protein